MMKLSQLLKVLIIGNPAEAAGAAYMRNVNIDPANGNVSAAGALNSIIVTDLAGSTAAPPGNANCVGQFRANKVWSAVWMDLADFQELNDELVYGKCYADTPDGAEICSSRCQMGVMGIASDTFGFALGQTKSNKQVPIGIGGWVLAYVDKVYKTGTPLTNDAYGFLTEMTLEEKQNFPERLIATYKKIENSKYWGDQNNPIQVNGRHWVKVK